ncbi:sugar isomerase domain-containing protein [Flexivirga caeni]|uniref:Sugar isomerase domain-containing protein n=1 Tax=Flexivirga caeni TaxID=2294115 RepID=A0A3M9MKL3_9MICO|nr:SIS domain-containing protein [Flexivirga caeni]RNI25208.1 sugar isomerase domain-containing protein [Flexivirga caeni]
MSHTADFLAQTTSRLQRLEALAESGGLDPAIDLLADSIGDGGIVHVFGTGHSEAFAMEIAGRAGGLIPTNKIALRDLVLRGDADRSMLGSSLLERDPQIAEKLWALVPATPGDVIVIASNSGVNGSIVGFALEAKRHGYPVIAVTSLEHTAAVEPKHPSGKRLSEIADVVIDNLAPYGDTTLEVDGVGCGAVSSLTAAFIAQLLTIGTIARLQQSGEPPVYISANVPGGHERNQKLEDVYGDRLIRGA